MKYELQKFGTNETRSLTAEQLTKLEPMLLATGKFIKLDDEIINISEIKNIKQTRKNQDYDVSKIKL